MMNLSHTLLSLKGVSLIIPVKSQNIELSFSMTVYIQCLDPYDLTKEGSVIFKN